MTAVTNQWINSYRRLATGFEAPDYVSWTRRGAAALVRVPSRRPGRAEGTRFELRSPDPACNPYMVLALVLAAGLRGIERGYELQAESIDDDPGAAARLPLDLREATDLFEASELARETLGDRLVDVFVANKRRELDDERRTVTEFDRARYLRLLMSDAWIYGDNGSDATSRLLAELGFSPHRVAANGTLRPPEGDSRAPALALVLSDGSEQPSCAEICARLAADEELAEVPVIVSLPADGLGAGVGVAEGHELLIEPFTAGELQARIARARRAVNGIDHDDIVRVGSLEMNLATYQVAIDGRPVDFTYMEYELLKFLVTHPRRVFSREALLSRVWGYDYYGGARTVDVHVRRVRAKLGSEHAARIKTVRSVGYRWEGT